MKIVKLFLLGVWTVVVWIFYLTFGVFILIGKMASKKKVA